MRTRFFYSVGFTTALHSINCLVVSPLWWSRKKLWAVSSVVIFCMSSASSSKSKRYRFSCIRSLWTVFGMMITSLCNSQRKATCAAVVPYFMPISVRVGLVNSLFDLLPTEPTPWAWYQTHPWIFGSHAAGWTHASPFPDFIIVSPKIFVKEFSYFLMPCH